MLTHRTDLTATDLAAVADLETRVVAVDGGRLKLEWRSLRSIAAPRLLCYDGDRLLGFLGVYEFGGVELAGMVDPAVRRRGIGSALLTAAREARPGAVLLVCPRATDTGRDFATAHGGVLDHSEHALVLTRDVADGPSDPAVVVRDAQPADTGWVGWLLESAFGYPPDRMAFDGSGHHVFERDGTTAGYLRSTREGDIGGVYGLVVDPALRGQGIGRDVLRRVCRSLRADGARRIALEVAVDNAHALGLYTSLGFAPVATEDYFRLG